MRRQILFVVSLAMLIISSCIVVAFVTNYLINKEQSPAKTEVAIPIILPEVDASQVSVAAKVNEPPFQLAMPVRGSEDKGPAKDNGAVSVDENSAILTGAEGPALGAAVIPGADPDTQVSTELPEAPITIAPQFLTGAFSSTMPTVSSQNESAKVPAFTPNTNTTGPLPPPSTAGTHSTKISPADFVPVTNTTGPVSPNGSKQKILPYCTPVTNTTGPVKTDNQ